METKQVYSVRILDQELGIHSDANQEQIGRIEEYLNNEIEGILKRYRGVPASRAVILAALNITEKYLNALDDQRNFKQSVVEKSKEILDLLEI